MTETAWHRVDPADLPEEGRVSTSVVDGRSVALTRCGGRLGALENRCPHQGGPIGEGSIEKGWLRCPWHGYDYDPTSGQPPEGFSDAVAAYDVEERGDGTYVRLPVPPARHRTVSDVLVETLVAHGVDTVFGMVGHSNLGFADARLPIACVEGWSASGRWHGVRLRDLLDSVGAPRGRDVRITSLQAHGPYRVTTLPAAFADDPLTLLALGLDGEALSIDHGYPCRLIAPDRPGVLQTKWVSRVDVL